MLYAFNEDPDKLVNEAKGHGFATSLMGRIAEEDGFKGWTVEEKSGGVTLYSGFLRGASRYLFDFRICRGGGWKQYDTPQDAWYFGVWIHPEEMVVVTYAEGDVIVKVAEDTEAFTEDIEGMDEFYH